MKKYLIIDDEPIAHRIIEGYCDNLNYLEKVGNCYNAFEALNFLTEHQVDLIFLDINMPKLTGFDFLKTLNSPPKIIVTTAYKEFALEGYELNIADYLLKPFSFERLIKAINKAFKTEIKRPNILKEYKEPNKNSFFIKGDKKIHQINFDNVLYIEAHGNYSKIFTIEKMILTHEKISSMQEVLPKNDFIRIHKSFIVAKSKIEEIEGNRVKILDKKIPIGQTYKDNLNCLL